MVLKVDPKGHCRPRLVVMMMTDGFAMMALMMLMLMAFLLWFLEFAGMKMLENEGNYQM